MGKHNALRDTAHDLARMTSHDPHRRSVLRALGLGAGAAAAPVAAHAIGAPALAGNARSGALRVALLLPSEDAATTAEAAAFHDGFRLAAGADDAPALAIAVHDIGSGVGRALAFARRQRDVRDADVAVAMVNSRAMPWLQGEFAAIGLPVVVANAGERMVRDDAVAPGVVYSSLELSTAAFAAGQWAAAHAGRRCAIACSWYESGFDMAPAFRAGFEAGGGTVVLSRVTETPRDVRDAAQAGRDLAASDADVVAAFYGGDEAREFFAAYGATSLRHDRVVMASPLLTAAQAAGVAVTSVASWSPRLAHAPNAAFVAAFTARHGRAPDAFAMLGHETARMLAASAARGARTLLDGVREARTDDVRGPVALDPRTHEMRGRLVLRTLAANGAEAIAPLAFDPTSRPLGKALPRHHGWTMPYQFA